jgi:acetyl-CoA C-acetyltransferase
MKDVTVSQDEGIRADTTYEGVAKIKPAIEGGVISAGNASQF